MGQQLIRSDGNEVVTDNSGTKSFSTGTITTAPVLLFIGRATRKRILFFNAGTVTVYLGSSSGVTPSGGFPLVPGACLTDDFSNDAWWAVTAAGTGDIRILEAY